MEAKNAPLQASASIGNATTNIHKAASFTISASEADYTEAFKVSVTNTGSGTLTANGSAVTFGKEFNISGGNTTMTYTPTTLGDHTLNFTVKDIYGQSKEFSVTIKADYANMTATASGPASMYVNRTATIALSLAEDSYTSNFTVQYSGGTGVLKNGSTTWNAGTGYNVANGSTNLSFTPTTTGSHRLNFTFTDSYGQSKQASVTINVTQAPLTVSATPITASVYTSNTATTTLAVSEAEHSEQFTVQPVISGSGTLSINGTNVGSSGTIQVNGGNSTVGYTPSTTGTHTITFNVTDAHGQSQSTVFTVTANDPEIAASVNSPNTYKTKPIEIVLNLDKPNYTGTFSTTVQRSGNGTLALSGGSNVTGSLTLGKGATRFTYTPTSTGTHTLTFSIRATDGKTKTVTSTINVTESPITLSVNSGSSHYVTVAEDEHSSQYADIDLYVGRSYYQGNLKLTLEKITCDQTYAQNNSTTLRLREFMVNNDLKNNYLNDFSGTSSTSPSPLHSWTQSYEFGVTKKMDLKIRCYGTYVPAAPGNTAKRFTLHFKATDDNGQSETITTVVYISLP